MVATALQTPKKRVVIAVHLKATKSCAHIVAALIFIKFLCLKKGT